MPEKKIEKTGKSFEIRNYRPGDENAICALFERVFGKPMGETESALHWQWEYIDNPLKEIFIKLAWDNERLVGQYAASPVRISVDSRDIIAALSHDTMTDPEYSGLGIFRNTAEILYADQEKANNCFIYGFPNRNSIHGFTKNLHWHRIMSTPVYVRPVNITTYVLQRLQTQVGHFMLAPEKPILNHEAVLLSDKSTSCELRIETKFGDWVDDLWQRCRSQHRVWVIRDIAYLDWRYIRRPESQYQIISIWRANRAVGYVITTCIEKEFGATLFVLDFLVDLNFQDAADTLIRSIIKLARVSRAVFISVLLTPGSKYRQLFRRRLFLPLPERFFPQPLYFGARCFDPNLHDVAYNPKAWSISWGDDDVL